MISNNKKTQFLISKDIRNEVMANISQMTSREENMEVNHSDEVIHLTIDDIRAAVLESFKGKLKEGTSLLFHFTPETAEFGAFGSETTDLLMLEDVPEHEKTFTTYIF